MVRRSGSDARTMPMALQLGDEIEPLLAYSATSDEAIVRTV